MLFCEQCGEQMAPGTRGRPKRWCSKDCMGLSKRKMKDETACWDCGKQLVVSGTAGHPKRYCDRKCAQSLRIRREQESRDRSLVCEVCKSPFLCENRRAKYCGAECRAASNKNLASMRWRAHVEARPATKEVTCGFCAGVVVVPFSLTGGKKYHDDCKLRARRARDRVKSMNRAGVKTNRTITHEEIAERDNFVCHICEVLVDMSLPRTSKQGATLDHVIPISKGGVDSLENLKLAHWICNIRKSDKIMGVEFVESKTK